MERELPFARRGWLERLVERVNHHRRHAPRVVQATIPRQLPPPTVAMEPLLLPAAGADQPLRLPPPTMAPASPPPVLAAREEPVLSEPLVPVPLSELPGRLFIVEGIDGSGKSTQLDLLHKWLVSEGYLVVFTEWNSSPIVKATTKRGKDRHLLSPMSFSLIHAADLANRVYAQIVPALEAGAIVLADRYIYTAFARDAVRGVSRPWLRKLYSFAQPPTLGFYFDVPLEEAAQRILSGRPVIKYYEAGMDLGLSSDPYESFQLFQGLIREEYDRLVEEFELVRIDATEPLTHQQQKMRELVRPHLHGVLKQDGGLNRALAQTGLSGRYLGGRTREDVNP